MKYRPEQRAQLEREYELLQELKRRNIEPYKVYNPYEKQQEFHRRGGQYSERAFFAGNQLGKTLSAAMESFFHLSGLYPGWWEGRRFDAPIVLWVGGDTGETIRDTSQRLLLDRPGKMENPDEYVGIIPLRLINGEPRKATGIPDLIDHIKIKYKSGGVSYCYFKAYAKGRQKWQGETVDAVWFDEEPPADIYSEGLTRTNNGQLGQFAYLTFTPLLGMSTVVFNFLRKPSVNQTSLTMTIDDVEHYTKAEKESIVTSYPDHEREARAQGLPIMGSGRIFPIAESMVVENRIVDIPDWWRQITGIDFGWDHPTGAVRILYDPENDVMHVRACHRQSKVTPLEFRAGILAWPEWIPVAWPHDGLQHDKGSGEQLAKQYKKAGLNILDDRATFTDGGNGVEAGVSEMLERMRTGRLKVDAGLVDWWEEFRLYHRDNGKIVKEKDDLMCATRYGMMMIRFAKSFTEHKVSLKSSSSWRDRLKKHTSSGRSSPMAA